MNFCVVPGCSSRSNRERHLSFHSLPLSNKRMLKQWIRVIGRKNLPLNSSSRVCSRHFKNSEGRKLRSDEFPTENMPQIAIRVPSRAPRRPPLSRHASSLTNDDTVLEEPRTKEVGVNTDSYNNEVSKLRAREAELEEELVNLRKAKHCAVTKFKLESIADDDSKVAFYTGFSSYEQLKVCFDYLGPAATKLHYRDSSRVTQQSKSGRPRTSSAINEFFLTLVRLHLGLLEQDIRYRFGVSQSRVSRVFTTWINFMYLQFKQIPIWPPQEFVQAYCTCVTYSSSNTPLQG